MTFRRMPLYLFLFVCIACLIASLLWGWLRWHQASRQSASIDDMAALEQLLAGVVIEESSRSPDDLYKFSDSLSEVLRIHRASIDDAAVQSLALLGRYETAGVTFDLSVLSKRPGLFRQTLEYKELTIIAGFDGKDYWQDNPLSHGTTDEVNVTEHVNAEMLKIQCSPVILAWQYANHGSEGLRLLERVEVDGSSYHVIQNDRLANQSVYHYIDGDTGLESWREMTVTVNEQAFPVRINFQYSPSALERAPVLADR